MSFPLVPKSVTLNDLERRNGPTPRYTTADKIGPFLGCSIRPNLVLFHRRTRTAYVYNGRLAWYNVVLTPRIRSSVKYSQLG